MEEGELKPATRLVLATLIVCSLVVGGFVLIYTWYFTIPLLAVVVGVPLVAYRLLRR